MTTFSMCWDKWNEWVREQTREMMIAEFRGKAFAGKMTVNLQLAISDEHRESQGYGTEGCPPSLEQE